MTQLSAEYPAEQPLQAAAVSEHSVAASVRSVEDAPAIAESAADAARQSQDVQIKFASGDVFLNVLRQRVDEYFTSSGRPRRDCLQMYIKTAVIMTWFVTSYVLLVFLATSWWQVLPLAASLGASMACIGFNIQHDGSHAAYSRRRWVNSLMGMTLDLLGGSSYIWKKTHNLVHHSFTNITGHDGDIDLGVLGRLSPHQRQFRFHRLQHVYLWLLYGFITLKWQFVDDTLLFIRGSHSQFRFSRPRGWDLAVFLGGKLAFLSLAFALPMAMHSWTVVIPTFLLTSFLQGVLLSVVFQLAHCVECAEFPMPSDASGRMENAWAVHQVETTVNFARHNRLVTWFTGGLNHQIEHHLFPQICHINYPALSGLLEQTCEEFGVRYSAHRTVFDAVSSHYRWLRKLGRETVTSSNC